MVEKKTKVKNWMKDNYVMLTKDTLLRDAINLLMQVDLYELPVVEKGKIIGVFQVKSYLHALQGKTLNQTDEIKAWLTQTYSTVNVNERMEYIESIPTYVLNDELELVGVIDSTSRLDYYRSFIQQKTVLEEVIKWYDLSFDTAYEGLAVVDSEGIIRVFNDAYSRYVGISKEEAIGKKAAHVIENTRLPVVLKTGVPERSQAHTLSGHDLIVHRLPIWHNNEIVGAVGMLVFEGVSEIYDVIQRMEQLELRNNQLMPSSNSKSNYRRQVRFEDILGDSECMTRTKNIAIKASKTKATVLLTGESGVGKEQFAKAIHDMGITSENNFVSVNCAAIPDNLIESELFGYEDGSFTGARRGGHIGKFEQANKGTLFLDEIGEMPLNIQVKILRALQEREIERIASRKTIPLDIRVIAATNQNLKQLVKQGKFREDLFYRLNVIPIEIPPLKKRITDIPLIVSYKMKELAEKYGQEAKTIDEKLIRLFYTYDWPGNVRELMNVLERLFVLTERSHISADEYSYYLLEESGSDFDLQSAVSYKAIEAELIEQEKHAIMIALEEADGNKSLAAKNLNISRATLYNKLSRFQIQ